MIYMLVGIIHTERFINGGALCHKLDGAPHVGGNVADGQEAVRESQ